MLFHFIYFYTLTMYASYFCVVQMGHSLPNAEINSYYKDFPVFGNLTKLLLCWGNEGIHEWDEVVKILQNCPSYFHFKGLFVTSPDSYWFLLILLFYYLHIFLILFCL